MADESQAGVAEPGERVALKERAKQGKKPKRQPRYNVILWDDQEHTPEYVITMMQAAVRPSAGKRLSNRRRGR